MVVNAQARRPGKIAPQPEARRRTISSAATHPASTSVGAIIRRMTVAPDSITPGEVLSLQGAIGNRAVGELLRGATRPRTSDSAPPLSHSAPQVRRKLESLGKDRFHGDVTVTDYRFEIEPARTEEFEGLDGEMEKVTWDERPVFVDESSDDRLAIVTVAIREKEKVPDVFQRLGVSYSQAAAGATVSGPGAVGDTNTARKGLILQSYLDVIGRKKAKFQAAETKAGEKWTAAMEAQLARLRECIAGRDNLVGWQVLKTLIKAINRVRGIKGAAPEKMTAEEKEAILKAVPEAKTRAFNLILGLFGDVEGIKREFRVNEEGEVAKVKSNLQKIAAHILQLKPDQIALDEDGTLAFNRGGAVNSGTGKSSSIKFSRHWLAHSLDRRAAELIHEASHGTEGVETKDLAYLGFWADAIIKGKSAIANAPTYERAAVGQAAKAGREPALTGKQLTLNGGEEQESAATNERLVKALGKIDFHVTQAWWFVNNVSGFAKRIPADDELQKDKTDTGYRWQTFQKRHRWVANVCSKIGTPVARSQEGRTVFTPVDQELIDLYVHILADVKDAVDALNQIDVVEDAPDKTIDQNVVHLPANVLGREDEQVQAWIANQVAIVQGVPDRLKNPTFYDLVKEISGWKDSVEPGVDKTGI